MFATKNKVATGTVEISLDFQDMSCCIIFQGIVHNLVKSNQA